MVKYMVAGCVNTPILYHLVGPVVTDCVYIPFYHFIGRSLPANLDPYRPQYGRI